MKKNQAKIIGVMSGTSLDGIDLISVHFRYTDSWEYTIEIAETYSYSTEWKKRLENAINFTKEELQELNNLYTRFLSESILKFIQKNNIQNIDAVSSHGHTIKHEPQNNYTLQIGNLPLLAKLLKYKVICDFRIQDVKLGGQGAPLVPIGDELLFKNYDYCLNLGGFANISSEDGKRIAYDICAVNTVLNFYAEKLGKDFDEDGEIADSGIFNKELYQELQNLAFYTKQPPKSLGIEWVNSQIFPLLEKYENDIPAILNTYTNHIATQIAENIKNEEEISVLVTGGGAFNSFLIKTLKSKTKARIILPSSEIINFKEALVFAFLGLLKLRGENNVLSSVTGAKKDHSSGYIFSP